MHVATISCQKLYQDFGLHFSVLSGLLIDFNSLVPFDVEDNDFSRLNSVCFIFANFSL